MRQKIRRGAVKSKDIITMEFTTEDFAASDAPELVNEHEFRQHGRMYDVVGAAVDGDKLVVRCIADEQENDLLAWFIHHLKDKSGAKKRFNSNIAFSFGAFGCSAAAQLPALLIPQSPPLYPLQQAGLVHRFGEVPAPPPWHLC